MKIKSPFALILQFSLLLMVAMVFCGIFCSFICFFFLALPFILFGRGETYASRLLKHGISKLRC